MSAPGVEAFLAELYTDERARRRFLADPRGAAARAGLEAHEVEAMAAIDRVGLELASRSFALTRAAHARPRGWRRWRALVRSLTAAEGSRYLFGRQRTR